MRIAQNLVVLTWNLHGLPFARRWKERVKRFAERVKRLGVPVDLLLCSEVWLGPHEHVLREALSPSFVSLNFPDLRRPAGGLVAYLHRNSAWRLAHQRFQLFRHAAPWWRLWEGDFIGGKGIRTLVLEHDNHRVAILHTHMQAQYGPRTYARVRGHQWSQLTQRAFSALASASFVCAAGDLNTMPTEDVFAAYARYWLDLSADIRQTGPRSTTVHHSEEWIDHVLALAPTACQLRSYTTELIDARDEEALISDHHGILARLELAPSASPPRWPGPVDKLP